MWFSANGPPVVAEAPVSAQSMVDLRTTGGASLANRLTLVQDCQLTSGQILDRGSISLSTGHFVDNWPMNCAVKYGPNIPLASVQSIDQWSIHGPAVNPWTRGQSIDR
jgi:hypothetical protein